MTVHRQWTRDAVVAAFAQHLREARGLAESTVRTRSKCVGSFLRDVLGGDTVDFARLTPAAVIDYISARAKRVRPGSVKTDGCALVSLFRFLRVAGVHVSRLDEAVPRIPQWRLAELPRFLDDAQLARLTESLDGWSTPRGRRERAIVLCLSELGLRASEVTELRLDDIDWRAGTLRIRSRKTRRGALLPLPHAVGEAIVAYLRRGRPATTDRRVFVKLTQGAGGPSRAGDMASRAVRAALKRARIQAPSYGAHLLRHTLATRLVRRGASLTEVADVLGHRTLQATAIYAKLDLASLSDVALPWPAVKP